MPDDTYNMDAALVTNPSPQLREPAQQPHLTLRASSGWQAVNLEQLWQYRGLLLSLAIRDVKLRYKQTALGVIWVVFQPLMAAGIFSFVFGTVAKMPSGGLPYFLFSYAGLLGWSAFSGTLGKCSASLVGNAHLISKVFFPRLILPLSTVFSSLLDFAVALGMMAVLLVIYGVTPGWGILMLPLWLLLILSYSIGVGLLCAALTVNYRDVQYILPVALQFLLYASPVAYAVSAVPERLHRLYYLNPLSTVLEGFRWSLLGTTQPPGWNIFYSAIGGALVFVAGAFAFKRMEKTFADLI